VNEEALAHWGAVAQETNLLRVDLHLNVLMSSLASVNKAEGHNYVT